MIYDTTIWHGEYHTVWYCTEANPDDESDWRVIDSHRSLGQAQRHVEELRKEN